MAAPPLTFTSHHEAVNIAVLELTVVVFVVIIIVWDCSIDDGAGRFDGSADHCPGDADSCADDAARRVERGACQT